MIHLCTIYDMLLLTFFMHACTLTSPYHTTRYVTPISHTCPATCAIAKHYRAHAQDPIHILVQCIHVLCMSPIRTHFRLALVMSLHLTSIVVQERQSVLNNTMHVCVQENYTEKSFSSVENYNVNVATKYMSTCTNVQNKMINNENTFLNC